jgi:hypothetical protein
LRSNASLDGQAQENRPPSPLVPSQVSENPKYQAHRDSMNLQHPQPRPGPTARHQSQLESQAQNFHSPISPNSEAWGSNPDLAAMRPDSNRHSVGDDATYPMSDEEYTEMSSVAEKNDVPPRPPKVRDDGPLVPQRPHRVKGAVQTYAEHHRVGKHPLSSYEEVCL